MVVIIFGEVWRPAGAALIAMCLLPAGGMLASIVSEALKAIGQPRYLTRLHLVTAGVTAVSLIALYKFGLTAAAASVSVGALAGGCYGLVLMHRVAGTPMGKMVAEAWPSASAATVAALVILPIEVVVVHAASHGFLLGLVLLAGEALAYALIYVGLLRLIAPQTGRELIAALRTVLGRIAALRRPNPAAA
jgi:PST family polysaccharide transporter